MHHSERLEELMERPAHFPQPDREEQRRRGQGALRADAAARPPGVRRLVEEADSLLEPASATPSKGGEREKAEIPVLPAAGTSRRGALRQILLNYVENARSSTPGPSPR